MTNKKEMEKVANLVAMDVAKNVATMEGKMLSVLLNQENDGALVDLTITVNDEKTAREVTKHVLKSPKYLFVDLDGYDVNCKITLANFLEEEKDEAKDTSHESIEDLFDEFYNAQKKQEENSHCCGCNHDEEDETDEEDYDDEDYEDDDWDDDEDYDEDWDDEDYEEEPELEKVYPKTIDGVWVLYIMNPHLEEGKLIADPYVGPDFKVATGHSYQEVAEKYAADIAMTHASGYETAILMPSHEELAKMLVKGNEYIPRIKAMYEGHIAYGKVADVLLRGTAIPDEVVDKIVEAAKCMKELDPDDNYHA